ncbi:copper transporter [Demequina capsici]|uniref:Copper transporter n=1 Tax=Demequina capsici TaxID=3075620 RepID=A0AA96F9Q7_9MICO|nr:copper transporter [Demequina sp. PMTSA13]WNM26124.1 copper transporter [Demequina sp. PMTSA13]
MTSFRYHVVSLAAVFLALAVGILLGSGPLRSALEQSLGEDVNTLQQQVDDAQAAVSDAQAQAVVGTDFANELRPALLDGRLAGVSIALVSVSAPADSEVEAVRQALVDAGATVTADVTIEAAWTDSSQNTFRAALAEQVAGQVTGVDSAATSSDRMLAHALAQALVPASDQASAQGGVLLDLLKQADLVSGTVTGSATAIVVVSGAGSDNEDARAAASDSLANVVGVLSGYVQGTVEAQGATATGDLASALHNTPDTAAISTVVEADTVYGQIATSLALAEQVTGGSGHYGAGSDGTLLPQSMLAGG